MVAAAASASKTPPVHYDVFIDEKITFISGVIVCTMYCIEKEGNRTTSTDQKGIHIKDHFKAS